MKRLVGVWFCGTLACVGCSSEEGAGAGEVDAETTLEIGEASCAAASTDGSITGQGFETFTPQTYSNPACYKAWVEGLSNFGPATVFAEWAVPPTSQSACVAAYVRADLYRKVNGAFIKIDQHSADGVWSTSTASCVVRTSVFASLPASTYKLAASARTTSSSSSPTRRLRLYGGGPGSGGRGGI